VKVGSTDGARGNFNDRISGMLNFGIGDGVDANVALPVPAEGSHRLSPWIDLQ
jgi:hypothetical protein